MDRRQDRYNPKRKLLCAERRRELSAALDRCARTVRYGGNPEHKRAPGDFGLTPPASARRGKSLCDDIAILRRHDALELVRKGFRRGLVHGDWSGEGWPRNVWSMSDDNVPLEAQREADGKYHGYPIPAADPFGDLVRAAWEEGT